MINETRFPGNASKPVLAKRGRLIIAEMNIFTSSKQFKYVHVNKLNKLLRHKTTAKGRELAQLTRRLSKPLAKQGAMTSYI